MREHNEAVSRIDFISPRAEITADAAPGEVVDVRQHDGSCCACAACTEITTPPIATRRWLLQEHQARGEVVTGLLYVDPLATDLHAALNTSAAPLNSLDHRQLCPGAAALAKINAALR